MHKWRFNELCLEFILTTASPLLIQAGGLSQNPVLPDMRFVRSFLPGKGEVIYIPGTSLKGVMRSYAERVIRTNSEGKACDPLDKERSCAEKLKNLEEKRQQELSSSEIYKESCLICRLFGNTRLKGRISCQDAYPQSEPKTEIRFGVAIDRRKQSVVPGALFEMEVAVSGNFKGKMFLENFELWQIGVLALGIGGLEQGILKLGFGKNRGFGEVNIKVEGANFLFAFPVPEDRIWGVGKFLNTESVREYEFALDNEIALRDICPVRQEKEFLGIRRVYDEQSWKRISNLCLEQLKKRLK